MGVSLSTLVQSTPTSFEELKGRTIAIDAYNTIYQFLSSIRDRFTGEPLRDSQGRITSHLSGLFYRMSKLIEAGVTPVLVFDGEPPAFKRATIAARVEVRKKAEEKWKQALKDGDTEKVRQYAQGATRLTKDMVKEAKDLLGYMGISWVQAPSEGEAQATHLLKQGKVWAVGSQDWDSLLFGADRMIKNLTISGRRKVPRKEKYLEIGPELIILKDVLEKLDLNQDQFILLGMLIGTDYNPGGIRGVGPKTALKLVKEYPTLDRLLDEVDWQHPTSPEEVFQFFKDPPVDDVEIPRPQFEPDQALQFLEDHDFSRERMGSVIKRLEKSRSQQSQKGLGGFFR